jgi:hypothetical protein
MSINFRKSPHTFAPSTIPPVVIRAAGDADRAALRRLAQRDSSEVPAGELLVAELDGELRAAVALESRRAIADPFRPTAELVELLGARADQLSAARQKPLRILARTPVAPRGRSRPVRERAAA